MAIMTINKVAKAGSASSTGNYSLIWSGLINGDSQACSHSHFCASEYAVRTVTAVKYES